MAQLKYSLNIKRATTPFWQNAHMSHMVSVLYCHTMSCNVIQCHTIIGMRHMSVLYYHAMLHWFASLLCCCSLLLCHFKICHQHHFSNICICTFHIYHYILVSAFSQSHDQLSVWGVRGLLIHMCHISYCLRLVGFPNPLATGSDIHNSWGT